MYIPVSSLLVQPREALQRLVNQCFFCCPLFQFFLVESAGLVCTDHPIEILARFTNGNDHVFRAQPT